MLNRIDYRIKCIDFMLLGLCMVLILIFLVVCCCYMWIVIIVVLLWWVYGCG